MLLMRDKKWFIWISWDQAWCIGHFKIFEDHIWASLIFFAYPINWQIFYCNLVPEWNFENTWLLFLCNTCWVNAPKCWMNHINSHLGKLVYFLEFLGKLYEQFNFILLPLNPWHQRHYLRYLTHFDVKASYWHLIDGLVWYLIRSFYWFYNFPCRLLWIFEDISSCRMLMGEIDVCCNRTVFLIHLNLWNRMRGWKMLLTSQLSTNFVW